MFLPNISFFPHKISPSFHFPLFFFLTIFSFFCSFSSHFSLSPHTTSLSPYCSSLLCPNAATPTHHPNHTHHHTHRLSHRSALSFFTPLPPPHHTHPTTHQNKRKTQRHSESIPYFLHLHDLTRFIW